MHIIKLIFIQRHSYSYDHKCHRNEYRPVILKLTVEFVVNDRAPENEILGLFFFFIYSNFSIQKVYFPIIIFYFKEFLLNLLL